MYNEEEKNYPEGQVTLSTREYRDLITECIENKKDYENYRSNVWELEKQTDKTEDVNKKLKTQVEGLMYYLKEKNLETSYKVWLMEQQALEEEHD